MIWSSPTLELARLRQGVKSRRVSSYDVTGGNSDHLPRIPDGERRPDLRVVVLDNGGGAIFRGLEQGDPEFNDVFDKVFGTPTSVDLAGVGAALGWRATRVASAEELATALESDAELIVCSLPAGG